MIYPICLIMILASPVYLAAMLMAHHEVRRNKEWIVKTFTVLYFVVVTVFIGIICNTPTIEVVHTTEIACLQDSENSSGSFFLGCGSINDEMKYYLYVKDDLGYKLVSYEADDIHIIFGEPALVKKQTISAPGYEWVGYSNYSDTVIRIPEGSIKNNFVLDAK